jgi:hypothetical protein
LASSIEILLKAKNETDAAFKAIIKNLESTTKETEKTNKLLQKFGSEGLSSLNAIAGNLGGSLGKVGSALGSLGPAGLAAAASIGAVVTAVTAAFKISLDAAQAAAKYADNMAALADKTGLSSKALQAFEVAGKLGNASIESIASAVNKMQIAMVNGSTAFGKLGLNIAELKKLAPEQQFQAVAKAIQNIEDPAERAAARVAVFGKAGSELAGTLKAAAEGAGELGGALSDEAMAAAAGLQDQTDLLTTAWERVQLQFGAAIAQSPEVQRALSDITDLVVKLAEAIGDMAPVISKTFDFLTFKSKEAMLAFKGALESSLVGGLQAWVNYKKAVEQLKLESLFNDVIGGGSSSANKKGGFSGSGADKAAKEAIAAAEKRRAAEQKASEEARAAWDKFYDGMKTRGERLVSDQKSQIASMAADHAKARMQQLADYVSMTDAMREHAKRVDEFLAEENLRKAQELRDAWMDLAATLFGVGDSIGGILGDIVSLGGAGIVVSENWNAKLETTAQKLQAVAGAINGLQAAFQSGSALGGAASGAAAGSAFGPWGAAIGGVVGAIAGLFGGAKKAREEMEKLKATFVSSQGGMTALVAKAKEAGIALDAMFRAKSAGQLQAAIKNIQAQLDLWAEGQDAIREAMDKYGITVGEMGPKFAQQELDKQAAEVAKAFAVLTAAGGDASAIAEKMGGDVLALVRQYQAAGLAIPEALRPVLEAMLKNGDLVDENGVAFESLEAAGIKFAESMTDAMKSLMDQIRMLVEALAKGFNIPINFNYNHGPNSQPQGPGGGPPKDPGGGGHEQSVFNPGEMGAGFGGSVFSDPGAMRELGQSIASALHSSGGGGSNRPIVIHNTLEMDGQKFDARVSKGNRQGRIRTGEQQRGRGAHR